MERSISVEPGLGILGDYEDDKRPWNGEWFPNLSGKLTGQLGTGASLRLRNQGHQQKSFLYQQLQKNVFIQFYVDSSIINKLK